MNTRRGFLGKLAALCGLGALTGKAMLAPSAPTLSARAYMHAITDAVKRGGCIALPNSTDPKSGEYVWTIERNPA